VIDVAVQLSVHDGQRRFDIDIAFASAAPVVALYGPSGGGKTLTLQAIAGLRTPTAGHVRVGGRTLFDRARGIDVPAEQRAVGYLFQQHALFPHLTVRQNIAFGLTSWRRRLSAPDAQRVDAVMQSFGLAALAGSRPATLSGGQQQRVALARALAVEPRVLLLDEPFASLNPVLRRQLREDLAATRERWGVPALLVTHDVEDVLALANVALLIDGGRVRREVDLDRVQAHERDTRPAPDQVPPPPERPDAPQLRALLGA
jgi:molybdate transport system ATP-binding protein